MWQEFNSLCSEVEKAKSMLNVWKIEIKKEESVDIGPYP